MGVTLFKKRIFFDNGSLFFERRGLAWGTFGWIMILAIAEMDISPKLESTN